MPGPREKGLWEQSRWQGDPLRDRLRPQSSFSEPTSHPPVLCLEAF